MLAAAAVSASAAFAAPAPRASVIRLHDLPKGFQTIAAHPYTVAAAAKRNQQSVAQLRSWGFVTAYEADYVRNVGLTPSLRGAFEVQSAISVYKARTGSKLSLARSSSACKQRPSIELKTSAKIGEEVHVCKNLARSNGVVLQAYAVLWRRGSRRGSLFMVGVQGGVTVGQAIALAKKQDARMH
jgi:hypothetical protein